MATLPDRLLVDRLVAAHPDRRPWRSGLPDLGYHGHEFTDRRIMDQGQAQEWLEALRVEHRDLDTVVAHLVGAGHHDSMRIQRLKKRKLKLKDMISRLESQLIPDLDA